MILWYLVNCANVFEWKYAETSIKRANENVEKANAHSTDEGEQWNEEDDEKDRGLLDKDGAIIQQR